MSMSRRELLTQAALYAGAGAIGAASQADTASDIPASEIAQAAKRVQTPHKIPRLVLEASYKRGEFDSHAVDCPFVFRHDGRFYMTHIGFDGTGYRTGLASSEDLITWKKEGLILDRGPSGSVTEYNIALTWIVRDNNLFGPGTLTRIGGKYVGVYHAYPKPGYESGPAVIGLCKTEDLRHWTIEEPFLHAEDGAEWERGGLYKGCLLRDRGVYYLFYNAKNRENGWTEQIGLATSRDLKHWSRYTGSPVVPVGVRGTWDDVFASDPCVLRMGKLWAMFYYGLSSAGPALDGVAFSRDLYHWTKWPDSLTNLGPAGSIDSRYAHKPGVFGWKGVTYHYYCAVAPCPAGHMGDIETGEVRGIALATSAP